MKVNFTYDKDKDIWCILNKDKVSNNSNTPTKEYIQLVEKFGENLSEENTSSFIDDYILENKIDISKSIEDIEKDWGIISDDFQKRAESIFGVSLSSDIVAYLTINSRCPYNIKENLFYVSFESDQSRKIIMHELWHFYTWYGLGEDQQEKLGMQKYNDLKESLTVLLNIECKDLLPERIIDIGYPVHKEIREKILEFWKKDKNIKNLWNYLVS